ncbi:MAG: acyltransferase family protein [Culicoidibacterales bacterium]
MKKRLYSLDLLRFILAISVVVLHFLEVYGYSVVHDSYNFIALFGVPFFHITLSRAVDVFFVLSGFTMVYSTFQRQSALTFLRKRAARIFPLYILATLAAIPFFMLIGPSSPQHKVFTIEYMINSFILRPTNQVFLISVAWTLSFEWIFYIIFAITMAISHKYRVHIVSLLFLITMCTSLFLSTNIGYLSVILDTHFLLLEFVAGMWIAFYYSKLKLPYGWLICLSGIIMMYGIIYTPIFDAPYRGLIFVIPASLIVIGTLNIEVKDKWENTIRKMGDISYTIYIVHTFTAFAFAYFLYNIIGIRTYVWFWLFISIGMTIITSRLIYDFLERPLYKFFTTVKINKQFKEK